jgi:ABC-2 type transport system permease protein
MAMILKAWTVFKLVWIERIVYRVNFCLEIFSSIVSSLIVVMLWMAIYKSSDHTQIGGYSLPQMVTYLIGGGLINTFILTTAENPETTQTIQDGSLSTMLIKPMSPYWIWFIRDFGTKSFLFVLGMMGYVLVCAFFRQYLVFSISLGAFFLFLVAMCFAAILQFFLFEALSLLAFWLENTYGIRFTMRIIMEVVGGAMIPISLFPPMLQKVFSFLPFPYMIYLPMRIFLNKIELNDVPLELFKEGLWIIGLGLLNVMAWKNGLRQYVAMGD